MMKMRFLLASALVSALLAASGPASASRPSEDDPIVVTGQVMKRGDAHALARDFTRAVMAPSVSDQNARWAAPICIGAIGLRPEVATPLIDRIEAMALAVGARVAKGDCQPNVMLAFAQDGDAVFANLSKNRPDLLIDTRAEERRKLRMAGLPVRWFYGQTVEGLGGRQVGQIAPGLRQGAVALFDLPILNDGTVSRINSPAQVSIEGATFVIDVPRVAHVSFNALADYLAFGILSRTRIDASPAGGSIMNLFNASGSVSPEGMTDLDTAMLTALYRLPINRTAIVHRNQMASEMIKTIALSQ